MQRRYRFRLYPHPHQLKNLAGAFGCARVVWNDALETSQELLKSGEKIKFSQLSNLCITQAKQKDGRKWLSSTSNVVLQQSLRDLYQAYSNYWSSLKGKRKGKKFNEPKRKKKRTEQSIRFTSNAFWIEGSTLRLTKIGSIPILWTRDLPSSPTSVTVSRDASGRFHASFVCAVDPISMPIDPNRAIGIDMGIVNFVTFNTGEKVEAPKPLQRNFKKLRRLQKALKRMDRMCFRSNKVTGRRQRGSHRYHRQQRRINRLHAFISDIRKDFQEKLSTRIIRENQTIVIEDLAIASMLRAPKPKKDLYAQRWLPNGRASKRALSRAISDASWGKFRLMLEHKAERYGRTIIAVNPAYTSQTCSHCGCVSKENRKSQSEFKCLECGHHENADVNAAKNILAAGLAESLNGRGALHKTTVAVAAGCEASTHLNWDAQQCAA